MRRITVADCLGEVKQVGMPAFYGIPAHSPSCHDQWPSEIVPSIDAVETKILRYLAPMDDTSRLPASALMHTVYYTLLNTV